MRQSSRNGTSHREMNRPILKNHAAPRGHRKVSGTLEKVLLVLIAACALLVVALSIQG